MEFEGTTTDTTVNETATTPVETSTESPPSTPSTPAPSESPIESAIAAKAATTATPPAATAPVYTPKLKYTVHDQEKEIPEFLRSVVKDAETEKQLHDLLTKADGLELVKEKQTKLQTENTQYKQAFDEMRHAAQYEPAKFLQATGIAKLAQQDSLGFCQGALGLSDDQIIAMAQQVLTFKEDPRQRELWQGQRSAQQDAMNYQGQVSQTTQQLQMLQTQLLQTQLTQEMSRPEIVEFAKAYDARVGRPGAFKEAVGEYGLMQERAYGKVVGAMEAVQAVYERNKPFISIQQTQTQVPQTPAQGVTPAGNVVPVIPNVGGSGKMSPTKPKVKSFDDLRRLAGE